MKPQPFFFHGCPDNRNLASFKRGFDTPTMLFLEQFQESSLSEAFLCSRDFTGKQSEHLKKFHGELKKLLFIGAERVDASD
jgi:hypothetical protein